ncbi:hypothetical protein [Streptomyces sp. TLI_105]|nr:hypothetical protein [Streptomyces sp. TLI_105]SEE18403.1 hypothetical protein SAMN05428939_7639 [Streptomyces sp. TLI_105]
MTALPARTTRFARDPQGRSTAASGRRAATGLRGRAPAQRLLDKLRGRC